MKEDPDIARMSDLEELIRNNLALLKQLNESRDTAEPMEKGKFELQIKSRKESLDDYLAEYDNLQKNHNNKQEQVDARIIYVPLVIVAMNRKEAYELMKEEVFDDQNVAPNERKRFTAFKEALHGHNIIDWESHYKDRREDWEPYISPNRTLDDIVLEITDRLNQHPKVLHKEIHRKDISRNFFSNDLRKREQARAEMRQSGGILIVDSISLFHPLLRESLMQSGAAANPKVDMLVLSPIDFCMLPPNYLAEALIKQKLDIVPSEYYEGSNSCKQGSNSCKLRGTGVGDLRALKRWLFSTLPKTVFRARKYNIDTNAKTLENQLGQKDQDYTDIIFGHNYQEDDELKSDEKAE